MKKKFVILFLGIFNYASFAQWSEQTSGVTTTLYSVSAVDNNIVWICGAGGKVLLTTNGGANWVITASPNAALSFYNIWGINATRALVTGSSSTTYVYRTTDAGASWTEVFSQAGGFINAIVNLSPPSGQYAMIGDPVAGRWSVWHSANGGQSWDSAGYYIPQSGTETGYNNSAFDIGPYGSDYFWFGTNNTRIYRGYFGQNWVAQPTTGQTNILAILFTDSLNGIAGGSTGILYTSNGGENWINSTSIPGTESINGFAVGYNISEIFYSRGGSIYRSSNNGVNWSVSTTQTGTYTHMIRARTADNYDIWAIRSNGGISKYTYPIGIKPIGTEIPIEHTLYQNYPNPFNPTTRIRFSIPLLREVSAEGGDGLLAAARGVLLRLYDILGREIATIVNEQLRPGTYEVEWDAANYPSGVYYYKLIAGTHSETKKMILIK